MSKHPGLGAMIQMLGGNQESTEAFVKAAGKKIAALRLDPDLGEDGALAFTFDDGSGLLLADTARSCCESRSLSTDDDLEAFVGSTLINAEVRWGGSKDEGGDEYEWCFLVVTTSLGDFTVQAHNHHNGYYGGICIRASEWTPK